MSLWPFNFKKNKRKDAKKVWIFCLDKGVHYNCIHGDTNLDGMFMMGMTSNHETMKTADTVFLKHAENNANIALSIKGGHHKADLGEAGTCAPQPIFAFKF